MNAPALFEREIDLAIQRFGPGWDALRGARLFITGGTGYFGRWLLPTLLRAHDQRALDLHVTVLSRSPASFVDTHPDVAGHTALTLHRGDVRDFSSPHGPITHLIHAAATAATATFHGLEDPLTKFDTSFGGARRVLDLAARKGVRRTLMISSGSFYGALRPDYDAYPEDYPVAPFPDNVEASVGHAKRAAEFLCAAYADRHGLSISTARCFSFLGPQLPLDLHYAVGNFIRDALWRDAIQVGGDGTPLRSYLYTGDLVVWLLTLLVRGAPGRAYNVGSDQPVTIADLARRVGRVVAPEKPVRILGARAGAVTRNVYLPAIARARDELGLDAWTPLDDAIRLTAEHARATDALAQARN